jgi:hypothetical protein
MGTNTEQSEQKSKNDQLPQQKTIQQFIQERQLLMDAKRIGKRPDRAGDQYDKSAFHYKVNIYMNGLTGFDIYYSMGSAHVDDSGRPKYPELPDVLDCLASDYSSYKNALDFEDFASEFGYDADSRKAEAIYNSLEELTIKMEDLLGEAACQELAFEVERL